MDLETREVSAPWRAEGLAAEPGPGGVCALVQTREAGMRACAATARETLQRLIEARRRDETSGEPFAVACHAGLSELIAPIVSGGVCRGALLCGGFFPVSGPGTVLDDDRRAALATIDRRTSPLELDDGDRERAKHVHPWLAPADLSFLGELLRAAAEEIAVVHAVELRRAAQVVPSAPAPRRRYGDIIGGAPAMQELYGVLDRVVQSDSTVLIQGENGTGKELVARAIHFGSARRDRRFVVTNCSAFNDNLLDSELFGHKKGAFTGAIVDKQGLFEVADRGTFFLDEIGDMSPSLQVKVLRVLQEGTFTPVGDTATRTVDVRIIAATNRDLKAMVRDGAFREDLYYRIHVINLHIPPLRERRDDIDLLVDHFFAGQLAATPDRELAMTEACRARLRGYSWPGNVRELENEIERLVVLAGDETVIDEALLSPRIAAHEPPLGEPAEHTRSLPQALRSLERRMILSALQRHKWNKTRASAELEVSRRNLIRLVQKYGLDAERTRGSDPT